MGATSVWLCYHTGYCRPMMCTQSTDNPYEQSVDEHKSLEMLGVLQLM